MEQKTVYTYDKVTGLYMGETVADESPLEPGVFLMPSYTTEVEPPRNLDIGFAFFWRGDRWKKEEVPALDADGDGQQDLPPGFDSDAAKVKPAKAGLFKRIAKAIVGQ